MIAELAFMIASVDGPKDVTVVRREPITVTAHLDSAETTVYATEVVTVAGPQGTFRTGPAEAEAALQPIGDVVAYHYRLCVELQAVKYWVDWGCVAP